MQLIWRHFHLSSEVSLCEAHIFPRLFKFSMEKSTYNIWNFYPSSNFQGYIGSGAKACQAFYIKNILIHNYKSKMKGILQLKI